MRPGYLAGRQEIHVLVGKTRYLDVQPQAGSCGVRRCREKRLACWLCLTCDAIDGRVLLVTHDYLSAVLGLRRAGVTETLIRFEERTLIRKTRGVLRIDDRKRIELEACSCYGIIASAYDSLGTLTCVEPQELAPLKLTAHRGDLT